MICQGVWEGAILRTPRGQGGFGYDPVFRLAGRTCTAAELEHSEKNRISHRGQAMQQMHAALRDWLSHGVAGT